MRSLLFLTASPLGHEARGHALAREAIDRLVARHPRLEVTERDLTQLAPGRIDRAYAEAILRRAPPEDAAFHSSEMLITELDRAGAVVISTPMHNYTVPAALKTWIDLVLRAGRSFGFRDGRKVGLLADRPVLVLVASGGALGPGARQPDHLTGYLRDVLATIGITDLRFVHLDRLADPKAAEASLARGRSAIGADDRFGTPARPAA